MKWPLRIGESAAAELADAVRWYEEKRRGLGAEFRDAIGAAFDVIRQQPEAGSRVAVPSAVVVRRHLIPRFAYQVVYYVRNEEVAIVAVAHTSRRPNYWRHRLTPTPA